jgi:hypothetical protein
MSISSLYTISQVQFLAHLTLNNPHSAELWNVKPDRLGLAFIWVVVSNDHFSKILSELVDQ